MTTFTVQISKYVRTAKNKYGLARTCIASANEKLVVGGEREAQPLAAHVFRAWMTRLLTTYPVKTLINATLERVKGKVSPKIFKKVPSFVDL